MSLIPRIIWEGNHQEYDGNYKHDLIVRAVYDGEKVVFEKMDGRDALGIPLWRFLSSVPSTFLVAAADLMDKKE